MAIDIIQGMQEVSPSGLDGLVLWLDASDESTITLDGAGNVSQWDDLSGSGNNFTSALGDRPAYTSGVVNGNNTLTFDGTNEESLDSVNGALVTGVPFTFFLVGSVTMAQVEFSITNSLDDNVYMFFQIARGSAGFVGKGLWNFREANNPSTMQASWVSSLIADTTNGDIHLAFYDSSDGVAGRVIVNNSPVVRDDAFGFRSAAVEGAVVPLGLDTMNIGHLARPTSPSSWMTGQMCELLIFNKTISEDVRLGLSNYLANKWGINLL